MDFHGGKRASVPPSSLSPGDICRVRITQLQHLCRKRGLEGLLFIPGADGKFNWGSQTFVNFVLLGKTGKCLEGETYVEEAYEALEDCVILVQPFGMSIFYSTPALAVLQPVLSRLHGVRYYQTSQAEMEDVDRLEWTKIMSFVDMMTRGVGVRGGAIGVPFPLGFDDARDLESWPLIQAFGLDEVGGHGFFTANYRVEDITPDLQALVMAVDAPLLDRILREGLSILRHHMHSTFAVLDADSSFASRGVLSETDILEPLSTLFEFAHLRDNPTKLAAASARAPRVLLGSRTSYALVEGTNMERSSSQVKVATPGTYHLVVEGEEPSSALRFSRTYFLVAHTVPLFSVAMATSPEYLIDQSQDLPSGVSVLHQAYVALVTVMQRLEIDWDAQGVESGVMGVERRLKSWVQESFRDFVETTVTVQAVDAVGSPLLNTDMVALPRQCLFYVRLVGSLGSGLGAVAVADTFLYVSGAKPALMLLTGEAAAPYFQAWAGQGAEDTLATRVTRAVQSGHLPGTMEMGQPLGPLPINDVTILLPDPRYPIIQGQLRTYTSGLALVRTCRSPLLLSFALHVKDVRICENPNLDTSCPVLQIVLHDSVDRDHNPLAAALPFCPMSSNPRVCGILLPSRSPVAQAILASIASWRLAVQQSLSGLSTVTEEVSLDPLLVKSYLCYEKQTSGGAGSYLRPDLILDTCYRAGLEAATSDLCLKNVPAVMSGIENQSQDAIPLTLLVGLAGSGVMNVARQIARFSDKDMVVVPVAIMGDRQSALDACFQNLSEQIRAITTGKATAISRPHILLAVVGSVNVAALCAYIHQRHDGQLVIKSVSTCVSLKNCQQEEGAEDSRTSARVKGTNVDDSERDNNNNNKELHGNWLPKLWDHMTEGFCSSVVITDLPPTGGDIQPLTRLRQWLRVANPRAQVLQCAASFIDPEVLSEITSSQAFQSVEAEALRARSVFPSWRALDLKTALIAPPSPPTTMLRCERAFIMEAAAPRVDLARLLWSLSIVFPNASVPALKDDVRMTVSLHTQDDVPTSTTGIRRAAELARLKVEANLTANESLKDFEEAVAELKGQGLLDQSRLGFVQSVVGMVVAVGVGQQQPPAQAYVVEANRARITLVETAAVTTIGGWEVTGKDLSYESLGAVLELARPYGRKAKAMRTRESLTQDEIKKVLDGCRDRPAPDGWWFDGGAWVDFFGQRLSQRPDLEDILGQYLEDINKGIREENERMGLSA